MNIDPTIIENDIFDILEKNINQKLHLIFIYKELLLKDYYNINIKTYPEKNNFDYFFLIIVRILCHKNKNIKINYNNENEYISSIILYKKIEQEDENKNVSNENCMNNMFSNNDCGLDEISLNNSDCSLDEISSNNSDSSLDEISSNNSSNEEDNISHETTSTDEINFSRDSINDNNFNCFISSKDKYYIEINNFIEKQKYENEKKIIDFIVDNELEIYYLLKDYKGNTIIHYLCLYDDNKRFNQLLKNISYNNLLIENKQKYRPLDFINITSKINKSIMILLLEEISKKDIIIEDIFDELSLLKPKIDFIYNIINIMNISIFIGIIYKNYL